MIRLYVLSTSLFTHVHAYTHTHTPNAHSGDNFMNGLYRMFLGDARPNNPNDEWVFQDVDSIKEVIIPASRISLKVHQDNFTFSEEYESPRSSYEAISDVDTNHVVTHENDKEWRTAVVTNQPSLLALRWVGVFSCVGLWSGCGLGLWSGCGPDTLYWFVIPDTSVLKIPTSTHTS